MVEQIHAGVAARAVTALCVVNNIAGALLEAIPGGPAFQLSGGAAAEFQQFLPVLSMKNRMRAMAASCCLSVSPKAARLTWQCRPQVPAAAAQGVVPFETEFTQGRVGGPGVVLGSDALSAAAADEGGFLQTGGDRGFAHGRGSKCGLGARCRSCRRERCCSYRFPPENSKRPRGRSPRPYIITIVYTPKGEQNRKQGKMPLAR